MPRRREVPKREILPDPKFGSVEISKFINVVMLDGKKAVAERIVYGALQQIEEREYVTEFRRRGIQTVWKYGIAFCGKKVEVVRGQY